MQCQKSPKIAERLVWAVETLAIDSADQVLEIGCGHGNAVWLICEKLITGTIIVLDPSEAMISAARKKNVEHIASGKAVFHTAALAQAALGDAHFDKIFAVNVNLFWIDPAEELQIIKGLLAPGGALYLFYEPPDSSKTQGIADKATHALEQSGYTIDAVQFKELQAVIGVCIIAHW